METNELNEENAYLRLLAESIDEVFWVASAEIDKTCYVSPAFEKVWGISRERLLRDPQAFIDRIHPEDRPAVAALLLNDRQGQPFAHDYRLLMPDGEVKWIHDHGFPIRDASGQVIRYAGVAKDITARKSVELRLAASERWLRGIYDSAPIGMAVVEIHGRFRLVNPALCAITGYSSEELVQRRFQDITHPADLEADLAMAAELLAGKRSLYKMEKRYIRKDGSSVWVQLTGVLVLNLGGQPDYFIAQIEDISERKAAQEALRKSQAQLRRLTERRQQVVEEERKRIAREVHDELGQLMTAIKMGLSLLRLKHATEPELESQLKRLLGLAEQGFSMVRNITSSLRPASLDLGLKPALLSLCEQFEVNTSLPCELTLAGLDRDFSETLATTVFRMVQESLTNVARHAKAAHVDVSVVADETDIVVEVADDGVGFDAWMAGSTIQGLGLPGIIERVEAMGGLANIVSNTRGAGTTIRATLPLSGAGD